MRKKRLHKKAALKILVKLTPGSIKWQLIYPNCVHFLQEIVMKIKGKQTEAF
jgi:hypothetical protein